ncbi:MAG: hypothetical protein M3461_13095 [Pseudomonadota bacterium]|nr:hypothetical protein [Pseudomonadota bacterium]
MSEACLAAQRLAFETGILAGRLAAFLDRVFPDADRAPDGHDFLKSAFRSAANGRPLEDFDSNPLSRPEGPPQPLDRLAGALALSRI